MAIYTCDVAYIDGKLLAHATNIKCNLITPDEDVQTIVLGWDGESPGPRKVEANFDLVNPTDEDYNFWQGALKASKVEARFQRTTDGKTLTSSGYLRSPTRDSGVGKAGTSTIEFHGGPADWE